MYMKQVKKIKAMNVSIKTWKILQQKKLDENFNSMNDIIVSLLNKEQAINKKEIDSIE